MVVNHYLLIANDHGESASHSNTVSRITFSYNFVCSSHNLVQKISDSNVQVELELIGI